MRIQTHHQALSNLVMGLDFDSVRCILMHLITQVLGQQLRPTAQYPVSRSLVGYTIRDLCKTIIISLRINHTCDQCVGG